MKPDTPTATRQASRSRQLYTLLCVIQRIVPESEKDVQQFLSWLMTDIAYKPPECEHEGWAKLGHYLESEVGEPKEPWQIALACVVSDIPVRWEQSLPSADRGVTRTFPTCKDHRTNTDWNEPELDDDRCILCRLFYLEAQESLLEEWQQRAKRAEETIAEVQRPLDAQMARLNETVVRLNEENEQLRKSAPSAITRTTKEQSHES